MARAGPDRRTEVGLPAGLEILLLPRTAPADIQESGLACQVGVAGAC